MPSAADVRFGPRSPETSPTTLTRVTISPSGVTGHLCPKRSMLRSSGSSRSCSLPSQTPLSSQRMHRALGSGSTGVAEGIPPSSK